MYLCQFSNSSDPDQTVPIGLSEASTCIWRNRAFKVVSRIDDVKVPRICVGTYFANHSFFVIFQTNTKIDILRMLI